MPGLCRPAASRATGAPLYVHFGELFPAPEDPRVHYDADAPILPVPKAA